MTISYGDTKFDIRTRERALREGDFSKEELEKHLKTLPDESKKVDEVKVFEEILEEEEKSTLTFSAAND